MKKLPKDAEASNILVGEVEELDAPFSVFIRLNKGVYLGDLTEVPLPTRFIFILLGPAVSLDSIYYTKHKKLKDPQSHSFYQNGEVCKIPIKMRPFFCESLKSFSFSHLSTYLEIDCYIVVQQ